MMARKTTSNPIIIQQRRGLENTLATQRKQIQVKKDELEIMENKIAEIEEALRELPEPAPTRSSQEVEKPT